MLAHDVGVNVARVHGKVIADQIAQACGVQRGARANDAAGVKAGELQRDMRHNIHRIGGDQEDSLESGGDDRLHNGLEHGGVALEQVNPALARFLGDAGADHGDIRIRTVAVLPGGYFHVGSGERQPVVEIHGLARGALLVNIDEQHLIADVLVQHGVGIAHAHQPGADQGDFSLICYHGDRPPCTVLFCPQRAEKSGREKILKIACILRAFLL